MFKTMIVEDNADFRKTLKKILHMRFPLMVIEEATNEKEALQKVDAGLPDLIFMDIKLPNGNGLELTKTLKTDHPKIIIIILTNYDLPEYQQAAYQSGADYFFSKNSTTLEDLMKLLESILSNL